MLHLASSNKEVHIFSSSPFSVQLNGSPLHRTQQNNDMQCNVSATIGDLIRIETVTGYVEYSYAAVTYFGVILRSSSKGGRNTVNSSSSVRIISAKTKI